MGMHREWRSSSFDMMCDVFRWLIDLLGVSEKDEIGE